MKFCDFCVMSLGFDFRKLLKIYDYESILIALMNYRWVLREKLMEANNRVRVQIEGENEDHFFERSQDLTFGMILRDLRIERASISHEPFSYSLFDLEELSKEGEYGPDLKSDEDYYWNEEKRNICELDDYEKKYIVEESSQVPWYVEKMNVFDVLFNGKFTIKINNGHNQTLYHRFDDSQTIRDLKIFVSQENGIPISNQIVIINGLVKNDSDGLRYLRGSDYRVVTVQLVRSESPEFLRVLPGDLCQPFGGTGGMNSYMYRQRFLSKTTSIQVKTEFGICEGLYCRLTPLQFFENIRSQFDQLKSEFQPTLLQSIYQTSERVTSSIFSSSLSSRRVKNKPSNEYKTSV